MSHFTFEIRVDDDDRNEWPRVLDDGRTVWACCVSSIGPACQHVRTDGWCWCGGQVGARVPGDQRGRGCLDDISHAWLDCTYTTGTADYCHRHGGHLSHESGTCDQR